MAAKPRPGALPGRVITADDLPEQEGLPGTMLRPLHLAILGAGSMFTPRLINDLLRIPGQQGGTIGLVDIDSRRLRTISRLIERLVLQAAHGGSKRDVIASEDRKAVMKGTEYLALMLDPLTAVVCSPAEIKAMALEMFRAEWDYLPGYR